MFTFILYSINKIPDMVVLAFTVLGIPRIHRASAAIIRIACGIIPAKSCWAPERPYYLTGNTGTDFYIGKSFPHYSDF